jgi:8-oxo-dGTP diphosphatase
MKKAWALVGWGLFWLAWPALFVYLKLGRRSRVIITAENRVLLVKGFISSGRWILPGGGIGRGETARQAAIREVREETGLELSPIKLKEVGEGIANEYGLRFYYTVFVADLPKIQKPVKRGWELTDAAWLPLSTLPRQSDVSPETRRVIAFARHLL